MDKLARKTSTDPLQENLRESKSIWNKSVSVFVNDLIHYKKLMNGWPNKFHMERSFIKEEIPADPATIIGTLANDFQEIAQKSTDIIQKQLDYSKSRRKTQPKQLNLPLSDAKQPSVDLSKQLSLPLAAWEKYNLISEASNPITRFFTRILTPTFGVSDEAMIRKLRMSLLDAAVKTFKTLGKLQVEIVKSSKDSISNSNKLLHRAWADEWMLINVGFTTYISNMPKSTSDAGGDISLPKEEVAAPKEEEGLPPTSNNTPIPGDYDYEPPPGTEEQTKQEQEFLAKKLLNSKIKIIAADFNKAFKSEDFNLIFNTDLFEDFMMSLSKYEMPSRVKGLRGEEVITKYNKLINLLARQHGIQANSLCDILKLLKLKIELKNKPAVVKPAVTSAVTSAVTPAVTPAIKAEMINNQIEKIAQDFLKKWVGKKRHQYSLFDKTSTFRLKIFDTADEMRKNLNEIMNLLEKGMDVDSLDPLIRQANSDIAELRKIMRALNNSERLSGSDQV